jgi:hypothetical protein
MWGSTATTQSWCSSHVFLATSSLVICGTQKAKSGWKAEHSTQGKPENKGLALALLLQTEAPQIILPYMETPTPMLYKRLL